MTETDMYRFNEDAIKSPEIQTYLDAVFQQLIDGLSDCINENLENGMRGLARDLNTYAHCKGYQFTEEESIGSLESAYPGFRTHIHTAIEESTRAFQQQLLAEAK
jgi:hypothetical protein